MKARALLGALLAQVTLCYLASAAFAGPPIVHVPAPRGTPPVRHGYELYSANCARCHGIAGRDDACAAASSGQPDAAEEQHEPDEEPPAERPHRSIRLPIK